MSLLYYFMVTTLNFCQWNLYSFTVDTNHLRHICYNWPTYWFFRDTLFISIKSSSKIAKISKYFCCCCYLHTSLCLETQKLMPVAPQLGLVLPQRTPYLRIISAFLFHTSQSPHLHQKGKKIFKIPLHEDKFWLDNIGRQSDLFTCNLVSLFLNMIVQQSIMFINELSLNLCLIFLIEKPFGTLCLLLPSNKTMPSSLCHPLRI